MNPVYDLIAERLVSYFGVPADLVRPEATMEDLEVDSLMLAEIAVIIEDEHGFRVEDAVADATVDMTLGEVAERLDRERRRAESDGPDEPGDRPAERPDERTDEWPGERQDGRTVQVPENAS